MDRNHTNQMYALKDLVDRALMNYALEQGGECDELPLNDVITLDATFDSNGEPIEVFAMSREYARCWSGDTLYFEDIDVDDIITLQDHIKYEYEID